MRDVIYHIDKEAREDPEMNKRDEGTDLTRRRMLSRPIECLTVAAWQSDLDMSLLLWVTSHWADVLSWIYDYLGLIEKT